MSAQATTKITYDAETDVGRSRRGKPNEDSIGTYAEYCSDESRLDAKGKLFVVADGMGGAAGGKEASSTAIRTVFRAYYDDPDPAIEASLERAFQAANSEVQQYGRAHPELRGMGTTIAAAVLRGRTLVIGNVGDSRAYLLRGDSLKQLSLDHTMVMEQVREGVLLPDEAAVHPRRHVLSRNLGYRPRANPDFSTWTLLNDDAILLCSDGLWGPIGDDDLAGLLRKQRGKRAVKALIEVANERGGPDNISGIVIHVDSVAAGPGSVTTEPVSSDGSVTTEPGAPRPVPPVVQRAAPGPGSVPTEPAVPADATPAAGPTAAPPAVAAAPAAPAAAAQGADSHARPGRSLNRLLPLLAVLVVLLGGGLLYRTLGSSPASGPAISGELAAAAGDSPSPAGPSSSAQSAAAVSPSSAASASGTASTVSQAVASRPAGASASAGAPSPEVSAVASAQTAPSGAAFSGFAVGAFPNTLTLSPDGTLLALGSTDGQVQLLNASDGTLITSVKAHEKAVASLAFSPEGNVLASADDDGTIVLWRIGSAAAAPGPSTAPAFEQLRAGDQEFPEELYAIGLDDGQLVYAGRQGEQIQLWRGEDQQPFATLDGLVAEVQSLVFAPDGQSLAVVTRAAVSSPSRLELRRVASGAAVGTVSDEPGNMWSVAFVPRQQSVVIGIPDDRVEQRSYRFAAEAPDEAQASASAAAASAPVSGAAEPLQLAKLLDLGTHVGGIVTVMFSDGDTLLSASRNGEIRRWTLGDAPASPAEASPSAAGVGE